MSSIQYTYYKKPKPNVHKSNGDPNRYIELEKHIIGIKISQHNQIRVTFLLLIEMGRT